MTPRILVVDDEQEFVDLLRYRYVERGYDILAASDGLKALNMARVFLPDIILLDILLPDLDGLSVCEILRHQPSTKKTPVILISALTGDVTQRLSKVQADDLFNKPLDFNRLDQRITALLKLDANSALNDAEQPPE
jgi:two-component system alkaline phosphatase synthesis response regulator PhoP